MKSIIQSIWKPLVPVALWGASFVATKQLLDELSPLTLIYMRLLLGVFIISLVALKRKRSFSINAPDAKGIFILALVACFHLWIQVTGLQYTSASNTGWIIGITPVFMVILGLIFFKEKMSILQTSGIFISFAGLLLLVSKGDISSIDFVSNKGDMMILMSAFTWSVYSLVGKKVTLNYPPMITIFYVFLTMIILFSPFTIRVTNLEQVIQLSIVGWGALAFLGILCSGLAYVLWAEAMNEMPASKVGAFLYLEPFVTVFVAWILLKEEITLLMLLSGLVILGGVIMVNTKRKIKN
jgi:RarD protein